MIERIAEARKYCRGFLTAFDIGAHVGTYSIEMSKHFGTVFAFEPVTKNYKHLCDNTNGSNIVRINFGVSDDTRDVFFDISGKSISCHIAGAGELCRVVALDKFMPDRQTADFIKIDVEGHELEVLRGAEKLIRDNSPVMLIEEKFDDRFSASRLLEKWGYRQVWKKKHDRLFIK